jgi:magnesium-transporting ATPase (P-type)
LDSNSKNGIEGSPNDIKARKEHYGSNENQKMEIRSVWSMIMEPFEDQMLKILTVAAFVSFICGYVQHGVQGLLEGASIIMAILIILVVTAANEYSQEKQFQQLREKQDEATVVVRRNGKDIEIDSQELVVGDLYRINNGAKIHADCILVENTPMSVNESSLTGESVE